MAEAPPFDQMADRLVRALALFGVLPALVTGIVVALLVSPLVGLGVFILMAVGWALAMLHRARGALDRTLRAVGAAPAAPGSHPRWENLVEGLSLTSGVAEPELWIVDGSGANALAAADSSRSALAVTPALLDALSVVEREAVAANLFGRLKDGSARYGTVTAAMIGPFLGNVEAAGKVLADGLGDQRAVRSDLAAVDITRYPPGLASALERLEQVGTEVEGVDLATAHLWLAPVSPGGQGVDPAVAETALQPLSLRVAVLQQL